MAPSPVAGNWPDHEDCINGLMRPDLEAPTARPLKAMPSVDPTDTSSLGAGRARGLLCAPGHGVGPPDPLRGCWGAWPPSLLQTWGAALGHTQARARCTKWVSVSGFRRSFPFVPVGVTKIRAVLVFYLMGFSVHLSTKPPNLRKKIPSWEPKRPVWEGRELMSSSRFGLSPPGPGTGGNEMVAGQAARAPCRGPGTDAGRPAL